MATKMTYLNLPNGGKIPALGLGTLFAKTDDEIENALNTALENGYRHIDTAWVYGNEAAIGKVLKKWFSSGKLKRDDIFITTKLPMFGVHQDRVELFMKKSLENLQLDYVDLYLIHFPVGCKYTEGSPLMPQNKSGESGIEPKTDHAAIWKKMEEQVEAGRAKAIGLSNYNIVQIETVLKTARIKPANLQVELHVFLQQRELINFCHKNGITVVAYCPLGSPGKNKQFAAMGIPPIQLPDILGNKVISQLAQKHSKTPAQIALRFLVEMGVVPIPKSVNPERIKENIKIFDFTLDDGDMKALYALEVGESARIGDFKIVPGIEKHPDYPFKNS